MDIFSQTNFRACVGISVIFLSSRLITKVLHLFLIAIYSCYIIPRRIISALSSFGKVLNDISTWHAVGLYWVPAHVGLWGNEITDKLARDGSTLKFAGSEPALGVSRQDIRRRIRCWLVNQHWVWWQRLGNTQRQAPELISGPCLGTKARFLSFNP